VRTLGQVSNRNGIGARVSIALPDGRRLTRFVKTGSSYCSQSELIVTFGLEKIADPVTVEVTWPSGRTDTVPNVAVNTLVTVQEGAGGVASAPLRVTVP